MSIREQILESLRKGDALTMKELVDAHGWDEKQKHNAQVVLSTLRKDGTLSSSIEGGRGLYQLADSKARAADKGPKVARRTLDVLRDMDKDGGDDTAVTFDLEHQMSTSAKKSPISPKAAKALKSLKREAFDAVVLKPVKPVEAVTGVRVRTSSHHVLIQTMELDDKKVAHTIYIPLDHVGPLIAALRDAKAAIA